MIIGIGYDMCNTERLADTLHHQGQRFRNRICSEREQVAGAELEHPTLFYAERFATKEACAKALGTGITDRVRWRHMEVLACAAGRPVLHLSDGALRRAKRLAGGRNITSHLSIERRGEFVTAFVMLEVR